MNFNVIIVAINIKWYQRFRYTVLDTIGNSCNVPYIGINAQYANLCVLLQLVGAAFGAAGQRCMALPTAVFVGKAKDWIPDLVERAKKLIVNGGKNRIKPVIYKVLDSSIQGLA